MNEQKYIKLKDGALMPQLGVGTWCLGNRQNTWNEEIEALQAGIDAGVQLIDTAEMYGEGRSEQLIGQAIKNYRRENLFLVSKVYPHNADRDNINRSIDRSLQFLGTDYLDLYLLHWRGSVPLDETVGCMEALVQCGKIKRWGVSNFDTTDMEELMQVKGGENCMVNQVLYHLGSRGIEYDLLPQLRKQNIPVIAYCPLAQAGKLRKEMLANSVLQDIAAKYGITVLQLLLAFVLHQKDIAAIPRSSSKTHILENWEARNIIFTPEDLQKISQTYPSPTRKQHLDVV